jgi:hypothetical protein
MSLTAVYQNELRKTRDAVGNALRQHWQALPDYRDAQVDGFVKRVVPIVEAGQRRAVAMTDAYMANVLGVRPIGLKATDLVGPFARNGVDPMIVYARPFTTVWTSIAKIGFDAAVAKGLSRLMSTGDMDVALAARNASMAFGQASDRVAGFQRVADPSCCDFCQSLDGVKVASNSAAPLHNRCGCTVEPIEVGSPKATDFQSFSPGSVFGDVVIEEHGELGPVITNKHDSFTSESELPKDYKRMLAKSEQEFGQSS